MSLNAIINLAERLLTNSSEQSTDTNSGSRQSKQAARVESDANGRDRFTPSAPGQQDAGLFQVKQFSFFSAAAEFLLSQTLQPQANPVATSPAVPANATGSPVVVQPTTALAQDPAGTSVAATPIVAARFPAANSAPIVVAPAAASVTANSTQSQLLALNTALAAL